MEEELKELQIAQNALDHASGFGLEAEVFVFALLAMKNNPSLSIVEAIKEGYEEWIK
jgi:hypothetical protein